MDIRQMLSQDRFPYTAETASSLESFFTPISSAPDAVDESVSQEGIVDGLKTFAGDIARNVREGGRPKLRKVRNDRERLIAVLRSYYANPQWLERRRMVEDDIKQDGFADYLSVGHELSTPADIDRVMAALSEKADVYISLLEKYQRELKPVSDYVDKSPVTDDVLLNATARLRHITHPDTTFAKALVKDFRIELGPRYFKYISATDPRFLGRVTLTKPLRWPNKRIPALTSAQVMEYANKVIELLTLITDLEERTLAIINSHTLSFAANPKWHGWDKVEEYQYGKGKVFKHLDRDQFDDDEEVDSPTYRALYGIASAIMTDPQKASDWRSLLNTFSGVGYRGTHLLNTAAFDIAFAVSKWIDRSLR